MISPIPVTGSKSELDANMLEHIKSLSDEENECHKRAMWYLTRWYSSMEWE